MTTSTRRRFYGKWRGSTLQESVFSLTEGPLEEGHVPGTGSNPPEESGLQRNTRTKAIQLPRSHPCFATASTAYSEQVGWKRQAPAVAVTECRRGESVRLYRA